MALSKPMKSKGREGFIYDDARHVYTLDGHRMYGVTTVLGVINKPALIQWSANLASAHALTFAHKHDDPSAIARAFRDALAYGLTSQRAKALGKKWPAFEHARLAHARKRDEGAETGTDVHAICERLIKKAIKTSKGKLTVKRHRDPMVQKFITWAIKENVTFLGSETKLYSKDLWVAGTCDVFFKLPDGTRVVGDIKTTGGIWDRTPFFQCAAYQMMAEEMGHKPYDIRAVIRLGKDGTFEVVYSGHPVDKEGFLGALVLFKALEIPATNLQKIIKRAVNKKKHGEA